MGACIPASVDIETDITIVSLKLSLSGHSLVLVFDMGSLPSPSEDYRNLATINKQLYAEVSSMRIRNRQLQLAFVGALMTLKDSEDAQVELEEQNRDLVGMVALAIHVQETSAQQEIALEDVKAEARSFKKSMQDANKVIQQLSRNLEELREDYQALLKQWLDSHENFDIGIPRSASSKSFHTMSYH